MIHELKCWTEYFEQIFLRNKKFELRKNDRDYKVGDTLILKEYDPARDVFTRSMCARDVIYILYGTPETEKNFGLKDGYCIMSLK